MFSSTRSKELELNLHCHYHLALMVAKIQSWYLKLDSNFKNLYVLVAVFEKSFRHRQGHA
jgi:hypothetical protein